MSKSWSDYRVFCNFLRGLFKISSSPSLERLHASSHSCPLTSCDKCKMILSLGNIEVAATSRWSVIVRRRSVDLCTNPVFVIYWFRVNDGFTRKMFETCSKLIMQTPERRQLRHSGVFIVNVESISDIVLVFPLLILN